MTSGSHRPGRPGRGGALQLMASTAALAAATVSGRSGIGGLPLGNPGRLLEWWTRVGPIAGSFAILRAFTIIGSAYWLVLSVIACSAHLICTTSYHRSRLRALYVIRRLPGFGLCARVAGTALAGAVLLTATAARAGADPPRGGPAQHPAPPRLVPLVPMASSTSPTTSMTNAIPSTVPPTTPATRPAEPVTEPVTAPTNPTPPAVSSPSTPSTPAGPSPTASPPAVRTGTKPKGPPTADAVPGIRVRIVRPGDDLWSIAADVVGGQLGRPASDREIAGYWLRLIATNRDLLPFPDEPGLIFPGEAITLPSV